MGRTILSATQTWVEEEKALTRFVRALRKSDQLLAKELIALARQHIAEASYASNLYPMDIYLVSMLLELHKKIRKLEIKVEQIDARTGGTGNIVEEVRGISSLLELVNHEVADTAINKTPEDTRLPEYLDFQEGA
jgi:hypothetical protein